MRLYSETDIKNIIETFLAVYLNLESVSLSTNLLYKVYDIISCYGIEVENIQKNND